MQAYTVIVQCEKTAFIAYIPIITSQRKKCDSSQIILAKQIQFVIYI